MSVEDEQLSYDSHSVIWMGCGCHMTVICLSCSQHGTYRVWPLAWLWSTDRDQTNQLSGVHRSWKGTRICSQCTLETEKFNQYQSRDALAGLVRHLDDMLALPDDRRQDYSFLCSGACMHTPIALATVDPAVVQLDMHCAPPDRWHGVVDMIDDLTGVVRAGLKDRKQAEVWRRRGGLVRLQIGGATCTTAVPTMPRRPQILISRFREAPRCDVYDKLKAGVFNLRRKTGEQLLSMFRQLIVVGHGLIPCKDWEAMIAYVRWADMLWQEHYTGASLCIDVI